MRDLSDQQVQLATTLLEQATYNHEQWHRGVLRVLVARLPPDPADLRVDAFRRCRFGQWFDSDAVGFLRPFAAFVALGDAHRRMHTNATELLQLVADDLPVSAPALDSFNNALDHLRLELQSLRDELAALMANRDPLTGAWGRATLLADLREQHALVQRAVQSSALAMIDLDHFKVVNDTFGHSVGDEVLRATSRRQRELIRPYDRLYRYGGEEFLLSMPHTGMEEARLIAERLRTGIAAVVITAEAGGGTIQVTASIGVSEIDAAASVEEAIDRADRALYRAKAAGRDRVEVAD